MSEKLTNFPAIIYSGFWTLKTLGKLKKEFRNQRFDLLILITDEPPAFIVHIENGDFNIKVLDNVKSFEDVEKYSCDGYLSLSSDIFLGGIGAILEGISNGKVKMKNDDILIMLAKVGGAF